MHTSLRAPVLLGALALAASACAPSTPAGSDDKEDTSSVSMLEDMVSAFDWLAASVVLRFVHKTKNGNER